MIAPPAPASHVSATGGGKPLRRDAAQNRERLLDAAGRVFAQRGLEAGVDEVAREAGVGMGTLYRRFPSKQALIDELVGGFRRDLLVIARRASKRTDGSGLEEMLSATGQLQASHRGCLQRLWNHSDAELDTVQAIQSEIAALLAAAQAHQRVRPEITTTDISLILWSVSGVIERTHAVAPKAWRRHLELLIAGLRPPAAGPFDTALTSTPMTPAQARRINGAQE